MKILLLASNVKRWPGKEMVTISAVSLNVYSSPHGDISGYLAYLWAA